MGNCYVSKTDRLGLDDVFNIFKLRGEKWTLERIGELYNLSTTTVRAILDGELRSGAVSTLPRELTERARRFRRAPSPDDASRAPEPVPTKITKAQVTAVRSCDLVTDMSRVEPRASLIAKYAEAYANHLEGYLLVKKLSKEMQDAGIDPSVIQGVTAALREGVTHE